MSDQPSTRPEGAPAWVDLSVSDLARSRSFYTAVLGWDYTGGEPEFGGYVNATVGGSVVAGMAPPMEGAGEAPHAWTVYLAVDDSAAAGRRISDAGGSILMEPMQVGPFGTMALYADPTGAVFGTWEAGSHTGFQITDVPGAVSWTEAMVGSFEQGKEFYSSVFGWTYQDMSGEGMEYAVFVTPGDPGMAGGIGAVEPAEQPYWSVVFAVDSTDDAVGRVSAAGGSVTVEPFDFEHGRLAVCTGPDGEVFGLIAPLQEPPG